MINWPNHLIEDIARRKCVLVLGAGISKNSKNQQNVRPKDWKEFLIEAYSNLERKNQSEIKRQIAAGDYLTACELIKREMGRDGFNSLVRNEFLTPKFKPAAIHEYIYNLDSRIVITPNFDKIYEVYANTVSDGSIIVKCFHDDDIADCIRRPEPIIIKIHGSVDKADQLIFTRKDYSEARTKYRDFYRIIEALSLTHTFIFLGCGVSDPDIRLILEDLNYKYPCTNQHFIVMPKKAIAPTVKEIISDTMKLNILEYDSASNHQELTASLEVLVGAVEAKRDEIAGTRSW